MSEERLKQLETPIVPDVSSHRKAFAENIGEFESMEQTSLKDEDHGDGKQEVA